MSGHDGAPPPQGAEEKLRVCVVGAGTYFMSGISYYTIRLTNELSRTYRTSAILMRRLLPSRLYPGRDRIGQQVTNLSFAPNVRVFDGVDWFWFPSLLRAVGLLLREHPDVLLLQWWTGTVLHSYLALALLAKLRGAKVIVEFHEVLDTAEARLGPVRAYVGLVAPLLMRLASGFIVHTATDRPILEQKYRLRNRPVAVIPHGPYDHHVNGSAPLAEVPCDGCFRLLYFGVVRPYKGVEDLVRAFNALPRVEAENYWLTVVGEVWEGWDLPARLIESSPYRDRITFVDRYVRDDEVAGFFASADAVVLPYHRSSASGPLHTAMSHGLPVITTKVGGLPEAVAGYDGALMVPPQDSDALCEALQRVRGLRGQRFADPHSWDKIVTRYAALFGEIGAGGKKV